MYFRSRVLQRSSFVYHILVENFQWQCPIFGKLHFSTSSTLPSIEEKRKLQESFLILGVEEDASINELKEVYISLAKQYHPDSGLDAADATKFGQVKEAYRVILNHHKCKELADTEEEVEKVIYDIKHTAPQHRQYLSFEGIGFGTQSQRQKQYQQHKVSRAADSILEHRMQRLAEQTEDAMVVKDKKATKHTKISNAIERIVEDLIQDAMNKGHFENLPGAGKPINNLDRNPFVDTTTHNLNKILINNGFTPEWIRLQGEIRKETTKAKEKLAVLKMKLGNPPFNTADSAKWKAGVKSFHAAIMDVNEKIDKYNLIVPFLNKQMVFYKSDKLMKHVCENYEKYLPRGDLDVIYATHYGHPVVQMNYPGSKNKIHWGEVWNNIKEVFRS
ncbi:dnaJ homolog subfamily C member 28-like [Gigantopelta aegis]|uniref:dnaJ homolog subfamily C member 28-like n=1 Tax=Gigantopelta aegis TaxID=1735272 RepID=UPI001B88C323|nr:dnaJ homolog subfamily C member 28-like [Gigantopelta aegis]